LTINSRPAPQVTVLDAGGQYCHLIARKARELGVYAEVRPSDTPATELQQRKAVIISGGPSSVYDSGSPLVDSGIFSTGRPVLGICYGLHLMAHMLGGKVLKGEKGEYGLATLQIAQPDALFSGLDATQQIWMSHRDIVSALPTGFSVLGTTETCAVAAMAEPERKLYAVQFHPEVVHTTRGKQILANFLFNISGCKPDWDPKHRIPLIEQEIREVVGSRKVFFFVSGGVDSTVAFTLTLRALGPDHVHGVYVDTGLMREGETEFVRRNLDQLAAGTVDVEDAQAEFLAPLSAARDPERKRQIIGEQFLRVQERIFATRQIANGDWILGQGTIYPDTIESGCSERAEVIKTHHNRVAGVQKLLDAKQIVEPLSSFYKDEVREIGRELGLPEELLNRQPFPGPGLAIRCLCSESNLPLRRVPEGVIVPVHSVGVQGDSRSYAPILVVPQFPDEDSKLQESATQLINSLAGINRVVAPLGMREDLAKMEVHASSLTPERLTKLRRADATIRRMSQDSGFDENIWQFPVILIPLGTEEAPDSIVLRPIQSVDGMTAQSVLIERGLAQVMAGELLQIEGICGVFLDLTHKPPGTIEWE
jgi:GMP synthase (glutamine-hydrolysing)